MNVLFGINIDPAAASRQLALALASEADELGLDLIGIQDHPYIGTYLDTWTLLAYLGARTRRVGLLTNVADLPLRPPAMLAKAAASLDILTEGRVVLGLGAGARWDAIAGYGGPGRTPGEGIAALAEAIEVMRAIWGEGEEASYSGRFYKLQAQPGPIPPRPIPIWLGVYKPRGLGLVGRLADGWSPSEPYAPPQEIPAMQRIIDQAA
jgi:alkanesulfonate monooxygenase SsuD/methylene tetrahydromethanopterin reductase-like flavin-dependent oxidoreductase (luciferase family)